MTTFDLLITADDKDELCVKLIDICKKWGIKVTDLVVKDFRGDLGWND